VSSNPDPGMVYPIQHYGVKSITDLRQGFGFLRAFQLPPPINMTARYNWNIVESGVKHYNPYPLATLVSLLYKYLFLKFTLTLHELHTKLLRYIIYM
jgi:hypothetical protein